MFLWDSVKDNLPWLLPLCLPVVFLLGNAFVKFVLGKLNFHLLGADTALCGCSLFSGTLLKQISAGKLSSGPEIATAILILIFLIFAWVGCVGLGSKERWKHSAVAALLGGMVMYLSSVCTWHIL